MSDNEEKKKSLDIALLQIEKSYGKGAIMRMGDASRIKVESIPSGSLAVDYALGIGGFPRGRIIEVYGPESSGKTTVCLHTVAEAQKRGGIAAFIDAENSLDPLYASKLGVDVNNLLISQPDYGEQALEICETLVRSGAVDVVVIDSVAALVPKSEIEGEMGDQHMGLQARLMSQALRKLTAIVNKSKCVVIFVNQLREKIGVMFGSPETTPGGRALKFYSSVRLDVRRIESIKEGQDVIGNLVKVKVVKNKVAPPFKQAEISIFFGQGISKLSDIIEVGTILNIVSKSGTWYTYGEMRLGQGKDNTQKFLKEHPETADEIERKIRASMAEEISPVKIEEEKEAKEGKEEVKAKVKKQA